MIWKASPDLVATPLFRKPKWVLRLDLLFSSYCREKSRIAWVTMKTARRRLDALVSPMIQHDARASYITRLLNHPYARHQHEMLMQNCCHQLSKHLLVYEV